MQVEGRVGQAARYAPYLPRLVRAWPGGQALELDGSLVSVDLSGFTALSERLAAEGRSGAEQLILAVSAVFDTLIRIAAARGADVLKFRGDALLLLFTGDGHEEHAVAACAEMQAWLESAGPSQLPVPDVRLRMASGVHSGTCTFFLVGSTHRELVVTGPAASSVVALESAAGAGEIVVSAATAAAIPAGWITGERNGAFLLAPRPAPPEPSVAEEPSPPEELADFVPVPLRRHIEADALEAEHRQVAVAFLKFGGTDALTPETLAARLAELADVLGEAVDAFGVTWLESDVDVDGGKLYLVSGAPTSAGDEEERLLLALRRVLDAGLALDLRAGVNRGHAFAGEIGSSRRRTYAVMGDTVNLAARLAARAGSGELLATQAALDRSVTRFAAEPRPFIVKGKERAVTALAVGDPLGRGPAEEEAPLPLVARDAELATLRAAVDAARRRERQLVELVGPPGIGKSRLVRELKTLAVGFAQMDVACEPYARSVPYYAFRALLRPLVGITREQTAADAGAQLGAWVASVAPDLLPMLPLLAIPFDAEVPPTPEADEVAPAFRRERAHELVQQFMQRVLIMPTALVVEDTHWLDDASQQLLSSLAVNVTEAPWLICASRRPEGAPVADIVRTLIELEPLPADDAARLALEAAGDEAVSDELVELVTSRAGGNPLFVRELIAAAARTGAAALPDSVESLVTSRIDLLDPDDRLLLRLAAVIGPTVELDLLQEVLGEAVDAARWERLGEFVERESDGAVRFRHDIFRTVAYEGLSFRRRRAIHGRLATVLEARLGWRADEAADLLSVHFANAERWEETWRYATAAGRRAQSRYANVIAAELYERALAAAPHLPELDPLELVDTLEALGDVCELFADFERAASAYEEARTLAAADVRRGARLVHKRGVVAERLGRFDEALDWYRNGLDRLGGEDAPAERALLRLGTSAARHRQGAYDDSVTWAERALADAERAGDLRTIARALGLLDANQAVHGKADPSFAERALAIYQEVGDLVGESNVRNNLGVAAYYEGRWEEAAARWNETGELSRRAGDVVSRARANNNVGEIFSDQGRLEEAAQLFEDARRTWRASGYLLGAHVATSNLGRAAARTRRFDEAHALLDEALRGFERLGSAAFAAETRVRVLEALVIEGRFQETLPLLDEAHAGLRAVEAAEATVAQLERIHAYALHQARRPDEARPHFETSLRLAREASALYELALTLGALADTGATEALAYLGEAELLKRQLGVVAVTLPPLP